MRAYILTARASLADEHPTVVTDVEQTREGVTLAKSGRLSNRSIRGVFFFVGWLGLCKSNHGLALRTDEAGGLIGEVETGSLALDDDTVDVLPFTLL